MNGINKLVPVLLHKNWLLSTAESCTGGMIGAALTNLPGSSRWYAGGIISYSNALKISLLDVSQAVLSEHGAVSEQVARAMALGACRRMNTEAALSVTGIAGPDGGLAGKPVGTVWFGWAIQGQVWTERQIFPGGRVQVRQAAVRHSVDGLLRLL